ncbi:MAG: PD-(D/E)XK nuclease family protein, partial [Bacteroidales bacterium]|nr:PD-(D/E)XK nuclease family protein [Bacteroidales bacterium]
MEYFLQRIAREMHDRYGDDLRDHCLVFPGRRSGIFFLKYLSAEIKRPVWAPAAMTINEYFRTLSDLIPAENEILLFELFSVYRTITKTAGNFDDFYFWGDIILNDFDDTDKYLADASKLFRNVRDIREIEELFGGLTEDQVKLVKRFWTNFEPAKETTAKQKFIAVWSVLEKLYSGFRSRLLQKNLAYEGMIFRKVAEEPDVSETKGRSWKMVHFIGFNALNECEKKLMLRLKEKGRAKFYWDYDNAYIAEKGQNSAGFFLKKNIKIFGNDMPADWNYDTLLSGKVGKSKRRVIETSSDIAQVKLIPHLLKELPGLDPGNAHNTAVVLADENLLLPLMSGIPPEIPDINITMGFPLKQTSAYILVKQLLALQRNASLHDGITLFSFSDVVAVLKNELIYNLLDEKEKKIPEEIIAHNMVYVSEAYFMKSEKLAIVFERKSTPSGLCDYVIRILSLAASYLKELPDHTMPGNVRNEFIYRIILALNRIRPLAEDKEITMSVDTWTRLLDRILKTQTVPFSGEPLSGIQVMGVLETRTLDFRNLIMISVNEGIIPSTTTASSFIPFSLRQAFGLPSINHRESIYAYHFYRLLHRAENVTFLFNSNPEGLRSGEMSRFLQQLKYSGDAAPDYQNLSFEIKNPVSVPEYIERTPEHNNRLLERYVSGGRVSPLSPSAVNTWLNCRMRFYYRYVNGLREADQVMTEIDPAALGSMVHAAMRRLYTPYIGKISTSGLVDAIIHDRETLDK